MSNLYDLYIQNCIQLAATVVIKSTDAADAMNQYVTDYFGINAVNEVDPTTWRYYLNISGQYHSIDTVMMVVSLDTLETIVFNKENLAIHTATAAAYVYGTRLYQQLVQQYPLQQILILGILYPVDIDVAIAASDGAILGYPSYLVEANEYSLITRLQTWVNGFKFRWNVKGFTLTDELYTASHLGIMYLNLLPAIINFRLMACKTNEAHSFHQASYLGSHQGLDVYLPYLTLEQSLWLCRNIAYIERNFGKQETFQTLVQKIMTDRGLPLYEIVMHHDLTHQPENLLPDLAFVTNPLNLDIVTDSTDILTLDKVLTLEDGLAPGNRDAHTNDELTIQSTMENALSNQLLTKVLYSNVVDYSNSTPITLPEVLFQHWLYLANNGKYITHILINNPRTGDEYSFSAKEAFVFMWYAFTSVHNVVTPTIPTLYADRVQRIPLPSVNDIMSNVAATLVSSTIAQQALSYNPVMPNSIISTEAFYLLCDNIYTAVQNQRAMTADQQHHRRRGMVQGMIERIYCDQTCYLGDVPNQSYSNWFASRNINVDTFTTDDLQSMYETIISVATGANLNTSITIGELQNALLKLLGQLSSYSIQFIGETNLSPIRKIDTTQVRVGDVDISEDYLIYHPDTSPDILDVNISTKTTLEYSIRSANLIGMTYENQGQKFHGNIPNLTHNRKPVNDVVNYLAPIQRVGIIHSSAPAFIPPSLSHDEWDALIGFSGLDLVNPVQ